MHTMMVRVRNKRSVRKHLLHGIARGCAVLSLSDRFTAEVGCATCVSGFDKRSAKFVEGAASRSIQCVRVCCLIDRVPYGISNIAHAGRCERPVSGSGCSWWFTCGRMRSFAAEPVGNRPMNCYGPGWQVHEMCTTYMRRHRSFRRHTNGACKRERRLHRR